MDMMVSLEVVNMQFYAHGLISNFAGPRVRPRLIKIELTSHTWDKTFMFVMMCNSIYLINGMAFNSMVKRL